MMRRSRIWQELQPEWDVIVVGGGITGAGIFHEAVARGLNTLLVDARDFAAGTSSRSSKLVHGGLRYLKEGQVRMTWASVHERQQLLRDAPGLVEPLGFLVTSYKGDWPPRWINRVGVALYDLMARQWQHKAYGARELTWLAPGIQQQSLVGGMAYVDAETDDARLVLRLILEGVDQGGTALNYVAAEGLAQENGSVTGVILRDTLSSEGKSVGARVVINATGAWADEMRAQVGQEARIRPCRGSHLVFPAWRLPVSQAVSFLHPYDGRWIFIFPWEGVVLVGTTDVDHAHELGEEPRISAEEVAYLMAALHHQYPSLQLGADDIVSTFAGVRPLVGSGEGDPYHESREHVVWQENGLLTVTGGKLTTFRLIARDALDAVAQRLPVHLPVAEDVPVLAHVEQEGSLPDQLDVDIVRRLRGRYGAEAAELLAAAGLGELEPIPGTPYLWAEMRWAARSEYVVHLEDLLSRRLRLSLLLPDGGAACFPRIQQICRQELGWDDQQWASESESYLRHWQKYHGLPEGIPDWREPLKAAQQAKLARYQRRRKQAVGSVAAVALAGILVGGAFALRKLSRQPHDRGWDQVSASKPARV